jgi:hypothetical protein
MRTTITAVLCSAALSAIALTAVAAGYVHPGTPSANLGIEVAVTPAPGSPGQFDVTSVLTDLQTNTVVAQPHLRVSSGKPGGRIQIGTVPDWMIDITISADGPSGKANYEATFTRDGKTVSRQKVVVNLGT